MTKPDTRYAIAKSDGRIARQGPKRKDSGKAGLQQLASCWACVLDTPEDSEHLVKDDLGQIQLFSLKLTSTKTMFINGKDEGSIASLNKALCKNAKTRGKWLAHLVSVEL